MTFRETLTRHLHAIQQRDLSALIETLPADRLTLVTSDGRLMQTTEEFVNLHRDWFTGTTWQLETEVVRLIEGADVGLALLRLDYRDTPPGQAPIHETSYLALVFALEKGRWVMVHDQNTPVRATG